MFLSLPKNLRTRLRSSAIYAIIVCLALLAVWGLYRGGIRLGQLEVSEMELTDLPYALLLSLMRIFAAYLLAIVFAIATGTLAAETRWGERVILPILDILQSIPIVGFFPAVIMFFIGLTQGGRAGVECAAIFLIFTSLAWNIAFSVYESVRSIPQDTRNAVAGFGLQGWNRMVRLIIPFCVPRLVFNSMLSWTNGWFFLVACEMIAQGPLKFFLPGIGSFLAQAANRGQFHAVVWGLVALTIAVVAIDFGVWRPTMVWAERFKVENLGTDAREIPSSFARNFYLWLGRFRPAFKRLLGSLLFPFRWVVREILSLMRGLTQSKSGKRRKRKLTASQRYWAQYRRQKTIERWVDIGMLVGGFAVVAAFGGALVVFFREPLPSIVAQIPMALAVSTLRIAIALLISLAWVLPVTLYVWNRPRLRANLLTFAQIGASLPAIALFPLFLLVFSRKFGLGMEFASLLMLLTGMQWYLLFNSLAGVGTIPNDLVQAVESLGLRRHQIWKKLVIPAIRPALVTGAITTWGGGWNALVIAEYIPFENRVHQVFGIGALLNQSVYELGDSRSIFICLASMILWIVFLNIAFWQPVYRMAINRYRMDL